MTVLNIRALGLCKIGYADDITDAMVWAVGGQIDGVPNNTRPANIISLSVASDSPSACPSFMQSAIDTARERGAYVVVASGNHHSSNASERWPCNCKNVICVAASTRTGAIADYSNHGPGITMSAPGGDSVNPLHLIGSYFSDHGETLDLESRTGTSFAAPNAAGMLALHFSYDSTAGMLALSSLGFMPIASGGGAGLLTGVSPLPDAVASTNVTCPSANEYMDPTTALCAPCTVKPPAVWGPASFVLPALRDSLCVAVSTYQNQNVYNCTAAGGGTVTLFWHATQWWFGDLSVAGTYWGAASAPSNGEQPALILMQSLSPQNVEMCLVALVTPTPAVTQPIVTTTVTPTVTRPIVTSAVTSPIVTPAVTRPMTAWARTINITISNFEYEQSMHRLGVMGIIFVIAGGAILLASGIYFALYTPPQRYQSVPVWA